MKRSWLLSQAALLLVVIIPLYLSILPSPLSTLAWWSRQASITAFFVSLPVIFVILVAFHSYRRYQRT